MVLFYDQEKKLKDKKADKTRQKKKGATVIRWVKRLCFAVVVVVALFIFGIAMVSHALKDSEAAKGYIETFVSGAAGYPTTIGSFEGMTLYPLFSVNLNDLQVAAPDKAEPFVTIGHFSIAMDFWDAFFSRAQVRSLSIENAQFSSALTGVKPLNVRTAALSGAGEKEGAKSVLGIEGTYGGDAVSVTADVRAGRDRKGTYYYVGESIPLHVKAPFLSLKGHLERTRGLDFIIEELGDPEKIFDGRIVLSAARRKGLNIKADLKGGKSAIVADITKREQGVTGTLDFAPLVLEDVARVKRVQGIIDRVLPQQDKVQPVQNGPRLSFSPPLELAVSMKPLRTNGKEIGTLSFDLKGADGVLHLEDVDGRVLDGRISGTMTLDGKTELYRLESDVSWQDWSYGALQAALGHAELARGTAVTDLKLSGEAATLSDLLAKLNGELLTVGGEGKVGHNILNLWGKGLFGAMFPSAKGQGLNLNMNCLIADFKIENSVAKASPLFLDTKELTVNATGTLDLAKKKIDMLVQPESKGLTLLSSSTAVAIRGDIYNPVITPSLVSIGKSLGRLFLGTVNPAFYATSLLDLGLNKKHPCYSYLETKKESDSAPLESEETSDIETPAIDEPLLPEKNIPVEGEGPLVEDQPASELVVPVMEGAPEPVTEQEIQTQENE